MSVHLVEIGREIRACWCVSDSKLDELDDRAIRNRIEREIPLAKQTGFKPPLPAGETVPCADDDCARTPISVRLNSSTRTRVIPLYIQCHPGIAALGSVLNDRLRVAQPGEANETKREREMTPVLVTEKTERSVRMAASGGLIK